MSESPKRLADVTRTDAAKPQIDASKSRAESSRVSKSVSKPATAPGDTAKASDSIPMAIGPFNILPTKFGRYLIRKELGRGQMGAVYLAQDTELDRPVALKVARTSLSGSTKLLKRMEVEAKAAAVVDHPLICKVYDAGEIDGIRFIALQYVEGEDLKAFLKRTGPRLDSKEAVRIVLQILRALEAAHEKAIIHRDLKPENVMMNKKNEPVIMDFGLARRTVGSSDAGLTQGMIVGTAAYMSPEQANGKADGIDHRSDLYAVGVMLYEMLTGEWPFTGSAMEVMGRKCVQEPLSPLMLNADLLPQLAGVCLKMIAQKKEVRFETCAEAIKALEAINFDSAGPSNPEDMLGDVLSNLEFLPGLPIEPPARKKSNSAEKSSTRRLSKSETKTKVVKPSEVSKPKSKPGLPAVVWAVVGGAGTLIAVLALTLLFRGSAATVKVEKTATKTTGDSEAKTEKKESDAVAVGAESTAKANNEPAKVAIHPDPKPTKQEASVQEVPKTAPANERPSITSSATGMKLVLIPAGTFMMGSPDSEAHRGVSEGPSHAVTMTRSFYMGAFEVTQGEYERVMGVNPSWFSPRGGGAATVRGLDTSRFPVEQVSWYDAIAFCNQMSRAEGLPEFYMMTNEHRQKNNSINSASVTPVGGNGYRLPTEAEWEYSCRATTGSAFNFGNHLSGDMANIFGEKPYGTNKRVNSLRRTTTVGSYAENNFGLFDMHGNVWEWVFDVYDARAYGSRSWPVQDPVVTSGSQSRVTRGSGWDGAAGQARSAARGVPPSAGFLSFRDGFRVVQGELAIYSRIGSRDSSLANTANNDATKKTVNAASQSTTSIPSDSVQSGSAINAAKPQEQASEAQGFVSVFNGKDLSGWTPMVLSEVPIKKFGKKVVKTEQQPKQGQKNEWIVRDGEIVCNSDTAGWLKLNKPYGDCEMRFEFFLPSGTDSGLLLRSPSAVNPFEKKRKAFEVQLENDPSQNSPEQSCGGIYGMVPPSTKSFKKDEWNNMSVVFQNHQITVRLNDQIVVDADTRAIDKLKGFPPRGHFCLINWNGKTGRAKGCRFKELRIKDLGTPGQLPDETPEPEEEMTESEKD